MATMASLPSAVLALQEISFQRRSLLPEQLRSTALVSNCTIQFGLVAHSPRTKLRHGHVVARATEPSSAPRSIVCQQCEGNGAIACSQCKGDGVNFVDHFGGRFKAGATCWLCRGKRQILCGNCNGAGFTGGFMSTADD